MKVSVRIAEDKDKKDIFDWRNDKLSRQMFHTSDEVSWEDHSKWFKSSCENPNRVLAMCFDSETGKNISIVRFDKIEDDHILVSLNIAPSFRGQGLATTSLLASHKFYEETYQSKIFCIAEIKTFNIGSQKSFTRAGYKHVDTKGDIMIYEYHTP